MARIPKDFIVNRLLPAAKIEMVISHYVTLKQQGSRLVCCCPFHHEKTPSFVVTPSLQFYHCFGCGVHGNSIDFVMRYRNVGFVEALEELSSMTGIPLEWESGRAPDTDRYKLYYELMDRCASYFSKCLEGSEVAKNYFLVKRKLDRQTIIKARLGYAPPSWNDFIRAVARNENEVKMLVELGMAVEGKNGAFAMFRNRVMIPIISQRGKVVSFGGRTLGDDKPKYINTKETPIFKKRNELFGLYEALSAHQNRPPRLVLMEGYMDVISVRQHGLDYAVASLGTATTEDHFKLMFRYTKQVICCYDGDAAGRKAAWHALETAGPILPPDCEVRFVFLPKEHDPDSLVQSEGLGGMIRALDGSISLPEFLINHMLSLYDIADPGRKVTFLNAILPKIKALSTKALQSVCLELLSKVTMIDRQRLGAMLAEASVERRAGFFEEGKQEPRGAASAATLLKSPMRRLIAFILQQPSVFSLVRQKMDMPGYLALADDLQVRGVAELRAINEAFEQTPDLTSAQLYEMARDTPSQHYYDILQNVSFIPRQASGEEYSLEDRAEFLIKIMAEVIFEGLSYQENKIKLKGDNMSNEDLSLVGSISKILGRRMFKS